MPPHGTAAADRTLLETLRRRIARIEGRAVRLAAAGPDPDARWRLGLDAVDARLPGGGLDPAGLCEIAAARPGDVAAAFGFAAGLAARRLALDASRPLLWVRSALSVREHGRLYGHGLAGLGLARHRLLTVTLGRTAALLWTLEQALASGAFCLVVGDAEHDAFDLTATRRLMLAAGAGATPCLALFAGARDGATAARLRWRVAAAPSRPPADDAAAPGPPAWRLELTRSRDGRPGAWTVEWDHATHRFAVAAEPSDRAPRPDEGRRLDRQPGGSLRPGRGGPARLAAHRLQ